MKIEKAEQAKELLESTYEMLCWCAENGHLKGGKE